MRVYHHFLNISRLTIPQKAFTVGEVVLSSFILTVGVLSVLSLISFSFRSSIDNQKLIIASELAQEGVELVRNIRDNALVSKVATGSPSDVLSSLPNGANKRCIFDYNDTVLDCSSPNPTLIFSGGFYQHGPAGSTNRFYRLLKIDHTGGANTARVKSFVSWQDPGSNLNGAASDTTWCTLANKCVYTEIFLTAWK